MINPSWELKISIHQPILNFKLGVFLQKQKGWWDFKLLKIRLFFCNGNPSLVEILAALGTLINHSHFLLIFFRRPGQMSFGKHNYFMQKCQREWLLSSASSSSPRSRVSFSILTREENPHVIYPKYNPIERVLNWVVHERQLEYNFKRLLPWLRILILFLLTLWIFWLGLCF